jgi:hypothetical protein
MNRGRFGLPRSSSPSAISFTPHGAAPSISTKVPTPLMSASRFALASVEPRPMILPSTRVALNGGYVHWSTGSGEMTS